MNRLTFFAISLVACALAIGIALPQAGSVPPDIQKIIDKASKGQPMTAAEQKRLKDWADQQKAPPVPRGKLPYAGAADPRDAIPCDITVKGWYELQGETPQDKDHYEIEVTAQAMLVPQINGNGNFTSNVYDQNAKVSTFHFKPRIDPTSKTGVRASGSGHWTRHREDPSQITDTEGSISDAVISMMFVTTGKGDALYAMAGEMGGERSGTVKTSNRFGGEPPITQDLNEAVGEAPLVNFPFPTESNVEDLQAEMQNPTASNAKASLKQFTDAITGKGPATIRIGETFEFVTRRGFKVKGASDVSISIRATNDLELSVDIVDYDTWLPKAGASESHDGNFMTVNVKLQRKDKQKLTDTQKITKLRFELIDVSHEPGVAMNYPNENLTGEPDFSILYDKNPKLKMSKVDQVGVTTTKEPFTEFQALVYAYDWGACGKLKVTAETPQGPLTGILAADGKTTLILLPKRQPDSMIADSWKQARGVTGMKDDDDSENYPVADTHKGDGLTLYEEYRGFIEKGEHFYGDPKKKNLMVMMVLNNPASDPQVPHGPELFRDATGLAVNWKFKADEFGIEQPDAEEPRTRIINTNHLKGAHVVDQHGLVIRNEPVTKGAALAYPSEHGNREHCPPRDWKYVLMTQDWRPGWSNWNRVKLGTSTITTNLFAVTLAHELLHAVNVKHHGDKDLGSCRVTSNGITTSLEEGGAGAVKVWKVSRVVTLREGGPGGAVIGAKDPRWITGAWKDELLCYIGCEKGQHSGYEDCLMRYDCASGYQGKDGTIYLRVTAPGATTFLSELSGIGICTSAAGTGVNASTFQPQSRFGDATRGNCAGQICINDRFSK